ncbi:peptide deformylase [Bifidobacterium saguinibicoloris]|uniref:peptide deformylase n=1 Tax=Bifidobacterium saguinibicoloris TaxID=2834433 RepID=UPI001C596F1F|nr:peptide deformylase [Bifidobacterium saguinibicoloris]MBW3079936.1 peptide deformylase [Bifidobacterium saguinibicoloris]
MQRPIITDEAFLAVPSEPATEADAGIARDLLDTLAAHADACVGLAANMIGVAKRIIVFHDETTGRNMTMFNPVVTAKSSRYETEEGCLSLKGVRPTVRYKRITVTYRTRRWREATATFDGFTAEIIQHEIDHCDGVLI